MVSVPSLLVVMKERHQASEQGCGRHQNEEEQEGQVESSPGRAEKCTTELGEQEKEQQNGATSGWRRSMCDYPEQQSGGVVCPHQAVDGLEKPLQ